MDAFRLGRYRAEGRWGGGRRPGSRVAAGSRSETPPNSLFLVGALHDDQVLRVALRVETVGEVLPLDIVDEGRAAAIYLDQPARRRALGLRPRGPPDLHVDPVGRPQLRDAVPDDVDLIVVLVVGR